ncbi:phosphate ABC transporter, permease protein PstA [bacterium CG2_30_54_10]|nr:MAG: phosphate ABC transporter, permease protein PstA [bacterium CG2_30_54_10]
MEQEFQRSNTFWNRVGTRLCMTTTYSVAGILAAILFYLAWKGIGRLSIGFFLDSPIDLGREGGVFPILVSTLLLAAVALAIAVPLGVGTAVYLTEYTKESWVTMLIRFGAECLAGIPSIIFGLFGFILFVVTLGMGWSILSGALTLACMVLPTIIRTSEEAIKAVPASIRQVGFSLGATKSQVIWHIVLPQSRSGIITGIILALGRVMGETACVIFTTGISMEMPSSLFDSARSMAVHFYILAREGISMDMANTTALALVFMILLVNLGATILFGRRYSR